MSIRVCIVEDQPELRENAASFLSGEPGFACVGAYASAEDALEGIPREHPDVVLMDINLPGMNGIECVEKLKGRLPELPVMMLTIYEDSDQVFNALEAGACGYLVKSTPLPKLLEAIREVHQGGSPMSSHIARKVVQAFRPAGRTRPLAANLAPREQEVLEFLAKGCPYKQIAAKLDISVETVRTYLRRIYEKLHVNSRTEAVAKYIGGADGGRSQRGG